MEDKNYLDESLPGGLKPKVIAALQQENLVHKRSTPKLMTGFAAALLAVVFCSGWFLKGISEKQYTSATTNSMSKYMLILQNPAGFVEDVSHAKEYGEWMNTLVAKGMAASGDELYVQGWEYGPDLTNETALKNISGYFLIEAKTDAEAQAIAQLCPHVKHNGIVILKKIVAH